MECGVLFIVMNPEQADKISLGFALNSRAFRALSGFVLDFRLESLIPLPLKVKFWIRQCMHASLCQAVRDK